ncbi:MAG: hypothetical protein M1828_000044 [Chrysothrix sp. TS-e1954]|nr:MAG: hypothetical protein M1828_000044 [Chrysothrix sp. TS-e1954]
MDTSSIPLQCSICPRKPHFSDVSHLLTHVASKGHLSFYYKLKVRASQEQEAKVSVDAYDHWYLDWEVEKLMSDRMRQKDRRRPRGRVQARPRRPLPDQSTLDPQLTSALTRSKSLKHESRSFTPAVELPTFAKPTRPKLHWWSTQHPFSYLATPIESEEDGSPVLQQYDVERDLLDFMPDIQSDAIEEVDVKSSEESNEMARLKGVIWPGMDIFDSATPYMRRKRNQKKETSVVERLEYNSQQVDAMERIYTPSGELKKQRKITGRVDFSSSPLAVCRSPPPRTSTLHRQVLTDKDANAPSMRRSGAEPARLNGSVQATKTSTVKAATSPVKPVKKRKRTINVYKDDNPSFGNPKGMHVLTSEFNYGSQIDRSHQQHDLLANQYGPPLQQSSSLFDTTFNPYQTYYHPATYGVLGVPAYDLSALLAQVSGFAPVRPNIATDQRSAEHERDAKLPIHSDDTCVE